MKEDFSDAEIADFLRRSYFAVDGLWFVKTEQKYGFEDAMILDEMIWDVMPKIQARKARELLGIEGHTLGDLLMAFQLKLAAEGYEYEVHSDGAQTVISVRVCPWYEILKSAGRTYLAEAIADRICKREFSGWAGEFSPTIEFDMVRRLCVESDNCQECTILFRDR